jgi:hypothetical protein
MTNRVHIDALAGVVEIEGAQEFVEALLERLFPLIEEVGFGKHPRNMVKDDRTVDSSNDVTDEVQVDASAGLKKRAQKSIRRPPAGHSCPARILVLKDEGFFAEHRSASDIVGALRGKGWTHSLNQVNAATSAMFKRSAIQRTKIGKGSWQYYWDRG